MHIFIQYETVDHYKNTKSNEKYRWYYEGSGIIGRVKNDDNIFFINESYSSVYRIPDIHDVEEVYRYKYEQMSYTIDQIIEIKSIHNTLKSIFNREYNRPLGMEIPSIDVLYTIAERIYKGEIWCFPS